MTIDQQIEQEFVANETKERPNNAADDSVGGRLRNDHFEELSVAESNRPKSSILFCSRRNAHGDAVYHIKNRNQSNQS